MDEVTNLLRNNLIEMGQRLLREGLVAGTGGNISLRLPSGDQVLITPSGMPYLTLQPADLVVLDLAGQVVAGERRPSIERELHLRIYQQRPDVQAVVHTHSVYASAVAATRQSIPPILDVIVDAVGGEIPCAEYAPHGSSQLAQNCWAALGSNNAVLLANHGVVAVGADLEQAYTVSQIVENAAKVYLLSHLIGKPVMLAQEVVDYEKAFMQTEYGQGTNK